MLQLVAGVQKLERGIHLDPCLEIGMRPVSREGAGRSHPGSLANQPELGKTRNQRLKLVRSQSHTAPAGRNEVQLGTQETIKAFSFLCHAHHLTPGRAPGQGGLIRGCYTVATSLVPSRDLMSGVPSTDLTPAWCWILEVAGWGQQEGAYLQGGLTFVSLEVFKNSTNWLCLCNSAELQPWLSSLSLQSPCSLAH